MARTPRTPGTARTPRAPGMARAPRTKSIRKLLSSFDAPEPSPSEVATTLKRLVLQREVDGDVDDEEDEGDDDDDEDADDDGLSPSTLLKQSLATREQWFRTQKTRAAYVNYVKSGKAWLADWVQKGLTRQHGKSQKNREPESAGVTTLSSEERSCFVGAFDEISQYTPIALRLLIAYKCDHLTLGFSTAEGIRAAFKEYFLLEKQCEGNVWRFNDQLKQWEGNPVFEIDFATYFESLKHRDERTSTTKRALPMLPDDLRIIMRWLDSQGQVEFGVTRCLYFKAFATTGFCLWTRNNELVGLRGENIKPHQVSSTGIEYHDFILRIRKTNADNTKEQHYWIPFDREHPEIDCFSHMTRWLAHLSDLRGRPVNDDDFIFPVMSRKGHLKYGQAAGGAAIQALLDEVVAKSGVMNGRRGKFTTHCFRRGGAQYRFMFAEDRWSLKVCKWWGAWSSNERVETLVRYLLEELSAYEDNFGDILMPDRRIRRQETFMGMPNSTLQQGPLELRPADVVEATLAAASKEVNQQQLRLPHAPQSATTPPAHQRVASCSSPAHAQLAFCQSHVYEPLTPCRTLARERVIPYSSPVHQRPYQSVVYEPLTPCRTPARDRVVPCSSPAHERLALCHVPAYQPLTPCRTPARDRVVPYSSPAHERLALCQVPVYEGPLTPHQSHTHEQVAPCWTADQPLTPCRPPDDQPHQRRLVPSHNASQTAPQDTLNDSACNTVPPSRTSTPAKDRKAEPWIPTANSFDDVKMYWLRGDPKHGLDVALERWDKVYTKSQYRLQATKYGQIKHIYEEYAIHCGGDEEKFKTLFPEANEGYTKLKNAVNRARTLRGERKARKAK